MTSSGVAVTRQKFEYEGTVPESSTTTSVVCCWIGWCCVGFVPSGTSFSLMLFSRFRLSLTATAERAEPTTAAARSQAERRAGPGFFGRPGGGEGTFLIHDHPTRPA